VNERRWRWDDFFHCFSAMKKHKNRKMKTLLCLPCIFAA
jgi:hypothetical protein